jgi:hypothetical protein
VHPYARVGEVLLTASAGVIADFGQHNDGKLNYGHATACEGRRSNLRGDWSTALFIWTAPADAPGNVKFRVTTATGSHAGFRQNEVTFAPNPDLPLPAPAGSAGSSATTTPPPAAAATSNYYPPPHAAAASPYIVGAGAGDAINVKFVIHGWLMAIGWGFFIPAGVWAVRYARATDDAPPAKSAFVEALRSRWFKLHWILNAVGLGCAGVGCILSYTAVREESGGGGGVTASAHLACLHSYYGAGALLLGVYQPLNAFLRPPGGADPSGAGKSTPRFRWEWVHRVAGVLGLFLSVIAVTSGTAAAQEWGAEKGGATAYKVGRQLYSCWNAVVPERGAWKRLATQPLNMKRDFLVL